MRLIDADALVDELLKHSVVTDDLFGMGRAQGARNTLTAICAAPTIDAVPVVRREWIAEQKGAEYCEFRCSACDGSIGQTDQFDETEVKQFSEWYKYCPCCGARMEGEEKP